MSGIFDQYNKTSQQGGQPKSPADNYQSAFGLLNGSTGKGKGPVPTGEYGNGAYGQELGQGLGGVFSAAQPGAGSQDYTFGLPQEQGGSGLSADELGSIATMFL